MLKHKKVKQNCSTRKVGEDVSVDNNIHRGIEVYSKSLQKKASKK